MNPDLHKTPSTRLAELLDDPGHARLLRQRAQQLAQRSEAAAPQRVEQYVRFRLGRDEAYGLPHGGVDEVLMVEGIGRGPGARGVWSGVVNRRGQMLAVLDPSRLFDLPGAEPGTGEAKRGSGIGVVVVSAA